ncbi:MAG: Sec-independent protein translocase protein TatB, partial [Lysobacterales bacterium]
MFDVGFAEIFLLALIGLLVLGPERLPGVARTVGGFVRKARMSWVSLRNTIESELAEADLSAPIKKTSEELKQIGRKLAEEPVFK